MLFRRVEGWCISAADLFDMRPEGVVSFEEFWREYPPRGRTPRRQGKAQARVEFAKVPLTDHPAMMAGLARDKASRDWLETRFIPWPHRWIKWRRWESEDVTGATFTPKERNMLKSWRGRVGSYCPPDHGEPQCASAEACNEKQLVRWTKQGVL